MSNPKKVIREITKHLKRPMHLLLEVLIAVTATVNAKKISFDDNYLFYRGDSISSTDAFTKSDYDDSQWNPINVPHDWSALDLPPRKEDHSTPTISVRYGSWKFSPSDDPKYAAAAFNDSEWMATKGGEDWRVFANYTKSYATGWYRQTFSAQTWQINATATNPNKLLLSLGIVAGSDEVYINGALVGKSGNITHPTPDIYLQWRRYTIPENLLKEKNNVVAIRITSIGGKGKLSKNGTSGFPGGLYDDLVNLKDTDVRSGPWDATTSVNGRSLGYSVGGIGWYRKHFDLQSTKTLLISKTTTPTFLLFDGIYQNSEIYLNERLVGARPYGYSSFVVDVTSVVKLKNNILAIKVSNLGQNSRWYSGSGIYRHVWLETTISNTYVPIWGVHITTPTIIFDQPGLAKSAIVQTDVILLNNGPVDKNVNVKVQLIHSNGDTIGTANNNVIVTAGQNENDTSISINITVHSPMLWSADNPSLYTAIVTLSSDTEISTYNTTFGIRQLHYSTDLGFQINELTTKLKGGCIHHANGILGAKTYDRSEYRRIQILKKAGYNAIRTSHNPVSPAFLRACDEIGMYVMDEAFDCWSIGKNPDDYSLYFNDWWQRDLKTMIIRDWNHPSVIMWSIGNEIPGRIPNATLINNLSHTLANFVRTLDGSRAVTSAYPGVQDSADDYLASLDVSGYNYSPDRYQLDHKRKPDRIIVGTESFPTSSFEMWNQVWNSSWVIGDFIWTSMDYIGESAIGYSSQDGDIDQYVGGRNLPFSWHLSFCGDFDIIGGRKPQGIYRHVLWNVSSIEMVVHRPLSLDVGPYAVANAEFVSRWGWPDEIESWNWEGFENVSLTVKVFTWQCNEITLELNGEPVQGSPKHVGYDTELIVEFDVAFQPGILKSYCTSNSTIQKTLTTASKSSQIKMLADRSVVKNDLNELIYIEVTVYDKHGIHVPEASVPITFEVEGGKLIAVGTGNPNDLNSFQSKTWNTWRGRILAIVQPNGIGNIVVKASGSEMTTKVVTIRVT